MTTKSIDEIGDITAPPGTKDWAIGIKNKLIYLVHQRKDTESTIAPYIEILEKHKGYRQLENEYGEPFLSLEDFIQARYPFGLDNDERLRFWLTKAKERVTQAASETTGDVQTKGGDRKSDEYKSIGNFPIDNQLARANYNGISDRTQRKLDYLARNATDLLHSVQQGKLSADRAYKMARGIKDPSPLDQLKKLWNKTPQDDKVAFLEWIN